MKLKSVILIILMLFISPLEAVKKKETFALSKSVYNKLQEVNESFDKEDYSTALALLDPILERKLSPYEAAQIWYMKGNALYQLSKLTEAADAFEKVVVVPDKIPELLRQGTLRTLSQLNLGLDRLDKAQIYGERLLEETTQPELDYALYAQILYQTEQYQAAKKAIEFAIASYAGKQKTPKENTLLLQNAIYFELQEHSLMLVTLKQLVKHYPKPTYLLYMASVYGQLGDNKNQTLIMETLYEDGQLKKDAQFINLASLYISEKVPIKGAKVLADAMAKDLVETNQRNLELLSQAWFMAAEYDEAISALGQAAKLAENGELYLRQAYLYFDHYKWQQANQAVSFALDKGFDKKEQEGEAHLLKAMVLFNMEKFDQAIKACQQAGTYKKTKKLASRWLKYISSEQTKYQRMAAF